MRKSGTISTSSLICQLALAIKAEFNMAFQECGVNITMEQWGVLKCLWQEEGISQKEIAERVNKDKASVTRTLDIMQKNKLIKRCEDGFDRRSYLIILTAEGKNLEHKLRPIAQKANQHIYRTLATNEIQELRRLLLKLATKGI